MKRLILSLAVASGAWLWGGDSAAASDVQFVRGGHRGHGHHGHDHHHHRGHHHHHHGHHHHFHRGYGHFHGGYPHYGGAYYHGPYYRSPYAWQTPYYGLRLQGRNFSFGYYGF